MIWLRSLVFFIGMSVSVVIYWPITMLAWPLPALLRSRIISGWAHFLVFWLHLVCGLKHRVVGMENLPATPGVLLCKHQSAWETIVLQTIFPPQAWVLKKELLRIPFFGWALAASVPIAINRRTRVKALDQLVKQGNDRLAEGRWVVVFPEGTRMPPGEMGKFNPGGAMLAVQAGANVTPVAHNAGSYWKRRGFLKHPGTITLVIGPSIETEGRKARDINDAARTWIEQTMADIETDT
jgi:1-acyl-sn-glycerol-3-phosphate acyltransferase